MKLSTRNDLDQARNDGEMTFQNVKTVTQTVTIGDQTKQTTFEAGDIVEYNRVARALVNQKDQSMIDVDMFFTDGGELLTKEYTE